MKRLETPQLILVVDDEPGVRKGIAQVLRDQGHVVRTAADGNEALDSLAQAAPNLVLLDVRLPGRDGVEILNIIRRDYPETGVIMIAAYPNIEGAVEALSWGPWITSSSPSAWMNWKPRCKRPWIP